MTAQIILGALLLLLIFISGWLFSGSHKRKEQNSQLKEYCEDLKDHLSKTMVKAGKFEAKLIWTEIMLNDKAARLTLTRKEMIRAKEELKDTKERLKASFKISASIMERVSELETESVGTKADLEASREFAEIYMKRALEMKTEFSKYKRKRGKDGKFIPKNGNKAMRKTEL